MSMKFALNEISDYVARAPKRWLFTGFQIVNSDPARLAWLLRLAQGTVDEKINRRAGTDMSIQQWKHPVSSSMRRHTRRCNIIRYSRKGVVYQHAPQPGWS
jgi:hypothetical protein